MYAQGIRVIGYGPAGGKIRRDSEKRIFSTVLLS